MCSIIITECDNRFILERLDIITRKRMAEGKFCSCNPENFSITLEDFSWSIDRKERKLIIRTLRNIEGYAKTYIVKLSFIDYLYSRNIIGEFTKVISIKEKKDDRKKLLEFISRL